ncbi:hypothetical protein LEN26_015529 [Aphanomyces euteiches]|nr:hypothetical protein LEN26_015529 [Aphanomyces euteiches]KAH9127333.1 hypothetical protein AeMF1_002355 [Aphanomyces euteiches]KAH9189756.1 hypothetical protein AeNC1_008264 [Aphanomyces euteiches]
MVDGTSTLVIDSGSSSIKAGMANDEAPQTVFPSVIGRVKQSGFMNVANCKETCVGPQAIANRGLFKLQHPIRHGHVENWDDLEQLWSHALYDELQVEPAEYAGVVVADTQISSIRQRERMTQIMFETFDVAALYVEAPGVLSLYASGRTTGCVLECGDGATTITAVHDGYDVPQCHSHSTIGGDLVTSYLRRLLLDRGHAFTTTTESEILREIKETHTAVAMDFVQDVRQIAANATAYQLPDGTSIELGREIYCAPEVLFRPSLAGVTDAGLHSMLYNAISQCDSYLIRRDLFKNIVLSGGSTMLANLPERISKELKAKASFNQHIHVDVPDYRQFGAWVGGAVLGSLSALENIWITKAQYDEAGPSIVYNQVK